MNSFHGIGRLTKNADLTIKEGKIKVGFVIAIDRYKEGTDFIPCRGYGERFEKIHPYLTKGKLIGIIGKLHIQQYEENGEKKNFAYISIEQLKLLSPKDDIKVEDVTEEETIFTEE